MNILIILLIACIFSWLYRKGGDGFKPARRIGIPLLATLLNWLAGANWWWLALPIGFAAFTLPITFLGDDINADKPFENKIDTKHIKLNIWISKELTTDFNYAYLPVLGVIIGLITLNLTLSIVFSLCFTVLTVLSNWKKTANIFTWDRVEYALGAILGLLIVL